MNRFRRISLRSTFVLSAALVLALACSSCGSTSSSYGSPSPGTDAMPPEVSANASAWPLPNRDYANTRAITDGKLTSQNVNQLGVAWSVPITANGPFGAAATTPLIVGDTVLYQDLGSNVVALDLATGKEKWRVTNNNPSIGPNGVAIGYAKVFAAKDGHTVAAWSLSEGKELWSTTLTTKPGEGIDIQPTVYDNTLYIATVPGSSASNFYRGGNVGIIFALDQASGQIKWQFDTVDSDDIWGNSQVNSGGGSWYAPAIDTSTGMTYWSTGNPAPIAGTPEFPGGISRPGPNLYTNSLLALDGSTGSLRWYRQIKSHDLFDLDFQISPILATATINGASHDLVIGAGKLGRVVAFDRKSGDILWNTPVGMHQNDDLQILQPGQTVTVYPGGLGGVETPMAYADGVVYVPILDSPTTYDATSGLPPGVTDTSKGTGALLAINVATGGILWQQAFPMVNVGGATVVNDLVFTSTLDGTVYALRRADGVQVWSWKAPAGINAFPAVARDTIIIPAGAGPQPALVALRLGAQGVAQPSQSASPAPSAAPSPSAGPSPSPSASRTPSTASVNLSISTPDDSRFDTSTLTAPANTVVKVTYTNNSDIPHDFAVFNGPNQQSPQLATTPIITGPKAVNTVTFTTPGPGHYFFYCSVHPTIMTGALVVQ